MLTFKIFQMILLPSIFILVLLILGSALFLFRKETKKIGKIFTVVSILLYYFFSITPFSDLIISPLENQYKFLEENFQNIDNIVLLSGGVKNRNLSLTSRLTESSLFRSLKAAEVYSKLDGVKIIVSGVGPTPERNEAEEIGKFLKSLNIPKENIILEESSKNTFQSAQEVKKIIGQEPFILVTSAYHLPRSLYIFKKVGLNPMPGPADFKVDGNYTIIDFFPDPKNLKKADLAFYEYFGILYYMMRY